MAERADAARNRRRILDAARRLFAERDVASVSLEEIAREAGVGKATLFRRFPDRQALFLALLDEHERALQDRILRGPPPLGPGGDATPAARLRAFARAMLDLTLEHRAFLLASETARPLARLRTGAYAVWHRHVAVLLAEAGAARPGREADLRAHLLLAAFDAELVTALQEDGVSRRALVRAVDDLVDRLAAPR